RERGLVAKRVEVRVAFRHYSAAVPHVDCLAEVLDSLGLLACEALASRGVEVEVCLVGTQLDQLATLRRRFCIAALLVERQPRVPPQLGCVTLDRGRQLQPGVTAGVVARLGWWRERRVGERADRDDDQTRVGGLGGE